MRLPKPLLKAFDWPAIRSRITVDGVIALADAEAVAAGRFAPDPAAVEHSVPPTRVSTTIRRWREVFEDQIACADLVLLTKADLAGEAGLAAARAAIAAEAPRPLPMLPVTDGVIDPRVDPRPRSCGRGRPRRAPLAPRWRGRSRARRFRLCRDRPAGDRPTSKRWPTAIRRLAREQNVLRAKGYVAVAGKPMRLLVQAVGERVRHQFDQALGRRSRAGRGWW